MSFENPNLPHLEKLSNRLAQAKVETQVHVAQYTAKMAEYQAFALMGDANEMSRLRVDCHSLLDLILDSTAIDAMLNKQVIEGLHDLSHLRGHF